MHILLASQSPRRRALIGLVGSPVTMTVADVDETAVSHPDPVQDTLLTARSKAAAVLVAGFERRPGTLLLAADTTVAIDGGLLGKPADAAAAAAMLRTLRGRTHQVHTAFTLVDLDRGRAQAAVHTAVVSMRPYTDAEIKAYVATGDPLDKAGAYAIQHPVFRPVEGLAGCFAGVMGLSICQLLLALRTWRLPVTPDWPSVVAAHQGYACPLLDRL